MGRIKISLPESFSFQTIIPLRITDLNYGGHVGNDTILTIIHEARMQYLASLGYTEMEFESTSLIMTDVAIEFKSELFYGDQVQAFVGADELSRIGFHIFYKLVNVKSGKPAAIAKTGMVCYDYQKRKPAALPDKARVKLTGSY